MKTLYESLLSNTHGSIRDVIKDWCDKNIKRAYISEEDGYAIDNDNKITTNKFYDVFISTVFKEKIPNYIKFGDLKNSFFSSNILKYIDIKNLPSYCTNLYFSGSIGETPKGLTMNLRNRLQLSSNEEQLKKINELHLHFDDKSSAGYNRGGNSIK